MNNQEIKWGAEIPVDGKRPEWLADDTKVTWAKGEQEFLYVTTAGGCNFGPFYGTTSPSMRAIKLPADHFYYVVQAWNEAHPDEEPFIPWGGGDEAPEDWDGEVVLYENGCIQGEGAAMDFVAVDWAYRGGDSGIIGYRKRVEQEAPAEDGGHVRVKRMTRAEAEYRWEKVKGRNAKDSFIMHLEGLDIIREETLVEQFQREQGWAIGSMKEGERKLVKHALEWMEKRQGEKQP